MTTPSTEAGRALLEDVPNYMDGRSYRDRVMLPAILAIEAEARRLTVEQIRERFNGLAADHPHKPKSTLLRILDEVAGLNASESPAPWNNRCVVCDTAQRAHGVMDHPFTHPRDASESPPPPKHRVVDGYCFDCEGGGCMLELAAANTETIRAAVSPETRRTLEAIDADYASLDGDASESPPPPYPDGVIAEEYDGD